MPKTRAHVFVAGKVQGVYFRQNTMQTAKQHGLAGWVRNLDDGRVEAVIEGDEDSVRNVVGWCHQGPSASKVDAVDVKYESYTGEFSDFTITG
ncbi:acylphosphatase [Nitrososphaera sp.]|uniref:acylphosphatase n=1 Tax=Nitrososphaera sp. TaxID=1971748 RepID=UPI002ED9FF88